MQIHMYRKLVKDEVFQPKKKPRTRSSGGDQATRRNLCLTCNKEECPGWCDKMKIKNN